MKFIKLNCLFFIFIFSLYSFAGEEKEKGEKEKYYADDMPLTSRRTDLYIRIERKSERNNDYRKPKKRVNIKTLDDFEFSDEEQNKNIFRKFHFSKKKVKLFLNGFYIQSNLAYYLYHFKQGKNQIIFDFFKSPFISTLEDGDTIRVEFADGASKKRKIYQKHEFTYKKGKNKYLWPLEIKKLSFKPHWTDAKVFAELSDKNRQDIKTLVNKLIAVYKNEDIDAMAEFLDSLQFTQNTDIIASTGIKPEKVIFNKPRRMLKRLYKMTFCGKRRRGFKSTHSFSITLNESNKKVINVFPKDNNPIYQVQSMAFLVKNSDGTPMYFSLERYGLNFIYVNDKWQLY